jgi:hypothetical protein
MDISRGFRYCPALVQQPGGPVIPASLFATCECFFQNTGVPIGPRRGQDRREAEGAMTLTATACGGGAVEVGIHRQLSEGYRERMAPRWLVESLK